MKRMKLSASAEETAEERKPNEIKHEMADASAAAEDSDDSSKVPDRGALSNAPSDSLEDLKVESNEEDKMDSEDLDSNEAESTTQDISLYTSTLDTQSSEDKKWRTGNKDDEELHLYEESFFYDCSFDVCRNQVFDPAAAKKFKCHKVVLARASPLFESMLLNHYQAGTNSRDDSIQLTAVDPDTFDLAMRFIYGNKKESWNMKNVGNLYKLANELQLDHLLENTMNFMRDAVNYQDAFNALNTLGSACSGELKEVFLEKIRPCVDLIFSSNEWYEATEQTVLEIFAQDKLDIDNEKELYDALVDWGTSQGAKGEEAAAIRVKIENAIRLIRFKTMELNDFLRCTKDDILTLEEKFGILMFLNSRDSSHYPKHLQASEELRHLSYCKLHYIRLNNDLDKPVEVPARSRFTFTFAVLSPDFILSGVHLSSFCYNEEIDVVCKVFNSKNKVLTKGNLSSESSRLPRGRCKFDTAVALAMNEFYTISVIYSVPEKRKLFVTDKIILKNRAINCKLQDKEFDIVMAKKFHYDINTLVIVKKKEIM